MIECRVCGSACSGLPIRHTRHLIHGKYPSRMVEYLADPAVPRTADGLLELCGGCQRWMFFCRGFINLLADRLKTQARAAYAEKWTDQRRQQSDADRNRRRSRDV